MQVLIPVVSLLLVLHISLTVFAQTEKKIKNILKSEISLLESLQEIDFTILKYEEIMNKTQKRIGKIQTKREEVRKQYVVSYEQVGQNKQMLLKRLRSLRLLRKGGLIRLLLTARTYQDYIKKQRILKLLVAQDMKIIRENEEQLIKLESQAKELKLLETDLKHSNDVLSEEKKKFDEIRMMKLDSITQIEKNRRYYLRYVQELEGATKQLNNKIFSLKAMMKRGTKFGDQKGKLAVPVWGTIVKKFGTSAENKYNISIHNDGVDFKAPKGRAVRAVYAGKVVHAGWINGYGMVVLLDHADGYITLYAHLENICVKEGVFVARGNRIGAVGETGSLEGPVLHFEIRYKGVALNPQEWF